MTHKFAYILVALVCLALTGYFAAVNTATVAVNFAGQSYPVSLALLTIKWTLVGAVAALCVVRLRRREEKTEQKHLEWKAQDAKLEAEIRSDEVKLLEAKVATLEAALNKALKKKS